MRFDPALKTVTSEMLHGDLRSRATQIQHRIVNWRTVEVNSVTIPIYWAFSMKRKGKGIPFYVGQ